MSEEEINHIIEVLEFALRKVDEELKKIMLCEVMPIEDWMKITSAN